MAGMNRERECATRKLVRHPTLSLEERRALNGYGA
jgi:hypothetical protein